MKMETNPGFMKTRIIAAFAVFVVISSVGYSQSPYYREHDISLPQLPGQFQVLLASARIAPRAYYLLYAAALDRFASDKAELLAKEPVLAGMVQKRFRDMYATFEGYDKITKSKPVVNATQEAAALQSFLSAGYHGKLKADIEAYIAQLTTNVKPPLDESNPAFPYLPGQIQVEFSLGRPAAKAYYLLYAAALDRFTTDKAELLAKEPILAGIVQSRFMDNLGAFDCYSTNFFPGVAPVVNAAKEADELRQFLSAGYRGKLREKMEAYVTELRKPTQEKGTNP